MPMYPPSSEKLLIGTPAKWMPSENRWSGPGAIRLITSL